jgi:Vitamin K-dependent gamma-carboxylase
MKNTAIYIKNNLLNNLKNHFLAPITAQPLGFFRICIALFAIVQIMSLYPNLLQIYGYRGFIQWEIGDVLIPKGVPTISLFASWFEYLHISKDQTVFIIFGLYLTSLLFLLVGYKTRYAAFAACFLHITMTTTSEIFIYGAELFTNIALFYCWILPVGHAYAMDNRSGSLDFGLWSLVRSKSRSLDFGLWSLVRSKSRSLDFGLWSLVRSPESVDIAKDQKPKTNQNYTFALRLLQCHLAIVYLNSGWDKAQGIQWWNGEAVWQAVMMPQLNQFDFSWLAQVPWVAKLLCWGTLVIEMGYPLFIFHKKTRAVWIALTVSLHVGIGICLGLWLFTAIMCLLTISIFGFELFLQSRLDYTRPTKQYGFDKLRFPFRRKMPII